MLTKAQIAAGETEPYPLPVNEWDDVRGVYRSRGGMPELHPQPCRMTPRFQSNVYVDVMAERERQDAKFGKQSHEPFTWLAILGEEVGEANQAALQDKYGGKHAGTLRAELVQVAAVAIAAIEDLDRKNYEQR